MSNKLKRRDWFTEIEDEDIERSKNQKVSFFDNFHRTDIPVFKPKGKEGSRVEYTLRICPTSWRDPSPKHWGLECYYHPNIGASNGSYLCYTGMEKMCQLKFKMNLEEFAKRTEIDLPKNAVCPIEEAKALRLEKGDKEGASQLYPRKCVLVFVIDRDNENLGPMLWRMPFKYVNEELLYMTAKKVKRISDPLEGYDIILQVIQQGKDSKNVNYRVSLDDELTPLHEDVETANKWLDFLEQNPIPKMLVFEDGDYISKVYNGEVDASERQEEEKEDIDVGTLSFEKLDEMTLPQLKTVALKLQFSQQIVDKLEASELIDLICKELEIKIEENEGDSVEDESPESGDTEEEEAPFDSDNEENEEEGSKEEEKEAKKAAHSKADELREKMKKAREEQEKKK